MTGGIARQRPAARRLPLSRRRFLERLAAGAISATACLGGGWWLLRGSLAGTGTFLRPPGALAESDFLATCIRCGRCADACPNRCISAFTEVAGQEVSARPGPGQRGTPVIFPRRQGCMLCQDAPGDELLCTAACPTGALVRTRKDPASIRAGVRMGTAEIDRHLCYSYNGSSCGVCVRACPLEGEALRAGLREIPIIDQRSCVGCGLCERACIRYPQAIQIRPRHG